MQHPMLTIALRAVRRAGNFIAKQFETLENVKNYQNNINEFAINVAKIAEKIIIETICKSYPQHTILNENNIKYVGTSQDVQWIINPLNGMANFIKRLPHFSISIAINIKNRHEVAVIYDPMRNELFTAIRGNGTQLNGYRLRGSNARNLYSTIIAIDFLLTETQQTSKYINLLDKLLTKHSDFRRTGSSALDLAYVAAGRFDGYLRIALKPWDLTAGELIAHESGALVCDFNGGHNYIITGNLIVGNIHIVRAILKNIRDENNSISKC